MSDTIQLENKIIELEKTISGITIALNRLNSSLSNKTNNTDLTRRISEINEQMRITNLSIDKLERKLSSVILPEDTRYYLDGGEIQSFQSNANTLKAMMTKFEKLYRNLVAYNSNA